MTDLNKIGLDSDQRAAVDSAFAEYASRLHLLQQEYDRHLAFSEQQAVKINEMRQHRDNMQRQVEKLQQEYDKLKGENESLRGEVKMFDRKYEKLTGEHAALKEKYELLEKMQQATKENLEDAIAEKLQLKEKAENIAAEHADLNLALAAMLNGYANLPMYQMDRFTVPRDLINKYTKMVLEYESKSNEQ